MKGACYPVIVLPEEMAGLSIRIVRCSRLMDAALNLGPGGIAGNERAKITEKGDCRIPFENISWITLDGAGGCIISLVQGEMLTAQVDSRALEKELPLADFIRISRTCIVNLQQVKSMMGNSLKIGNTLLTISPDYRKQVCDRFVFIGVRIIRNG